jgi:quinol monooxygenase YgiN
MVITILEAQVEAQQVGALERAYREMTAGSPPAGALETFLTRDSQDRSLFRIMTVWASREALEQMRASVNKPGGVLIFEAAGATPTLSTLDVVVHVRG